jgi:hypothetical protein
MVSMRKRYELGFLALVAAYGAGGCRLVIGFEDAVLEDAGAGGHGGAGASSTSSSSGGGASSCMPNATEACYSGPDGTQNKGICQAGKMTCKADGSAWGDCAGDQVPQAETCATTTDENCDGYDCALWAKFYGDSVNPGTQDIYAVATDSAGNFYVGGDFIGPLKLGNKTLIAPLNGNAFIAKLGPDGELVWAKQLGDKGAESIRGIAVDSAGNVAIIGSSTEAIDLGGAQPIPPGIFVAKLDSSGGHLWSVGLLGTGNSTRVAFDPQGNVVIAGGYSGTMNFGAGPMPSAGASDVFVAKLRASDGSATAPGCWAKSYGDVADQAATDVAVDGSGNILITGNFEGNLNINAVLTSAGSSDVFIAKLTPAGSVAWRAGYGDNQFQRSTAIAVDSAGSAFLTGYFSGNLTFGGTTLTATAVSGSGHSDAFVAKLNYSGSMQWAKSYGSDVTASGSAIAVDATDNVHMTGEFAGTLDLGGGALISPAPYMNVFAAKLDGQQGSHLWSRQYGGKDANLLAYAIATIATGETLLGGITLFNNAGTPIDLGAGTFTTIGYRNGFLIKLAP